MREAQAIDSPLTRTGRARLQPLRHRSPPPLKTMHLERSFLALLPTHRHTADISAARNFNNPDYLSMCVHRCTYKYVHKSVPSGTLLQIALMFLEEHFQALTRPKIVPTAARYTWAAGQPGAAVPTWARVPR